MKRFYILLSLLFLVSAAKAQQVASYPEDQPIIDLRFPDDWDLKTKSGVLYAHPSGDKGFFISLSTLKASGDNRNAAVKEVKSDIEALFHDVEYQDPQTKQVNDLDRLMEIVRLGEGMDATGEFAAAALERTFAVCDRYAEIIESRSVEKIRFVATSASRDARNRDVFVAGVKQRLGVEPDVISGDEEARLSFAGATNGLVGANPPYLVVDIGGGSTEFVLGVHDPEAAKSVNIGCVRMTERHFRNDPPSHDEVCELL